MKLWKAWPNINVYLILYCLEHVNESCKGYLEPKTAGFPWPECKAEGAFHIWQVVVYCTILNIEETSLITMAPLKNGKNTKGREGNLYSYFQVWVCIVWKCQLKQHFLAQFVLIKVYLIAFSGVLLHVTIIFNGCRTKQPQSAIEDHEMQLKAVEKLRFDKPHRLLMCRENILCMGA